MILSLQAKRERLVCESHCLNKHVYSLHAKEFISFEQCIITPGFSFVSIIWSWQRKRNKNLPLLQRRRHTAQNTSSSSSEMFLGFLRSSPHLKPLEHTRDLRTQVHIDGWYRYYRWNIHRTLIVNTMLILPLDSLALALELLSFKTTHSLLN